MKKIEGWLKEEYSDIYQRSLDELATSYDTADALAAVDTAIAKRTGEIQKGPFIRSKTLEQLQQTG